MQAVSEYAAVAGVRAKELRTRLALAVIVAGVNLTFAPSIWPLVWVAAVAVTQGVDLLVFRGARRGAPLTRGYRALCLASTVVSTAVYSSIAAYAWFAGGDVGRVFASVQIAGALLHVTLHMHRSRDLLLAAALPHAAYFLALPLADAFFDGKPDPAMAVIIVGDLLFMAHLVVAAKRSNAVTQALTDANEEAERERRRAEAASDAKSGFLATMTHEIRTPMNAVISAANLLKRTDLTEQQAEHVAMLVDAGDVLMGLLNDVLDLSKIEAGKMTLEEADVDLPRRLDMLVRLWGPRAADKGLTLALDTGADLPTYVRSDALRLQQILSNLLSNAVKFTGEGGRVTLRASVTRCEAGDRLRFDVIDTGCGLSPDAMDRIFSEFEQAEAGTSRRHGGTGLGLSISRRLARLLGGDLTVSSKIGEGSTFTLQTPLVLASDNAKTSPAADDGESMAVEIDARPLSILLAEDHEVNRRIVALFLEPLGWRLTIAEDGGQAVQAAATEPFDAILMDMQMPVLNGLEAAMAIREGGGPNASTPIVALTANALDHHRAAWDAAAVAGFLTKPIDPKTLTETLVRVATQKAVSRRTAA
jgi:signal transduction histidine kinase/ActR/RegA family two-component response regulator